MTPSDIKVGRHYLHKNELFVRKVLGIYKHDGRKRVYYVDQFGEGNCLLSVFAAYVTGETRKRPHPVLEPTFVSTAFLLRMAHTHSIKKEAA